MKILSANGAEIPALGFGTWTMKGAQARDLVAQAIDTGYRHIDTAAMYDNEADVGQGIATSGVSRNDLFLTTKVWPDQVKDGSFQDSVRASLDKLAVDQLDLLLIHWPPKTEGPQAWAALLDEAVENGWTRHVGVSNFTVSQLDAMVEAGTHKIVCNQVENHPYLDQSKIRAACARQGMALIAYCPLYRDGGLFSEPAIVSAADAHGKSSAQIILRWHVQHEGGGAIPKTATPSRLPENINIFDFELSDDEMAAISALGSANNRICDFEFSPEWDAP